MGNQSLKPSWMRATVLYTVVTTVFASMLLVEGIHVQRSTLDALDHANQTIVADRALVRLATTMESNLRGYLATGDPVFLASYKQGAGAIDEKFDALNKLMAQDPVQQARRGSFRKLFNDWIAQSNEMIRDQPGDPAEDAKEARSRKLRENKALMDSLRTQYEGLTAGEVTRRNANMAKARSRSVWLTVYCFLFAFVASGSIWLVSKRQMRALSRALRNSAEAERARDAIAMKFAQQEKEEAEAGYRGQVEAINRSQMTIEFRLDSSIIQANDNYLRAFGYTPQELVGKSHSIFVAEEDQKNEEELWANLRAGKFQAGEYKRVGKMLNHVWIAANYNPILDKDGAVARILEFATDVTSRKQAEEDLREKASLLDLSHDTIMVRDLLGKILFWNRGAEEMYGYTKAEAVGKISHTLLATSFPMPLAEIETEFLERGRWEGELEHTLRNGKRMVVASRWSLQRDGNGMPFQVLESNSDITDRIAAEEASRKAQVEAEIANQAKSEFLANMSHEVRTPLNAIIGMAYLGLRANPDAKQRNYLSKIDIAAAQLLGIINDILDVSKIEARKLAIEHIPFQLDEVLRNVRDITAQKAEEKKLPLVFSVEANVPNHLIGDPLRLGQVLTNLVNNAVKFTEKGEIAVDVSRNDPPHGQPKSVGSIQLKFSVFDTGIGISPAQRAKLFQAFHQADSSFTRKYGGTGLGLTICKQLTDLMGGEIWVESKPGAGSTFYFTALFDSVAQLTPDSARGIMVKLVEKSVLVVDEDPVARQALAVMLRANGMEVRTVASGEEALTVSEARYSEGRSFDLALIDWRLPGIDGLKTARHMEGSRSLANIPAILMTSAFERAEVMDALSDGLEFAGLVASPVIESELLATIQTVFASTPGVGQMQSPSMTSDPVALRGRRVLLVDDNDFNREFAGELLADLGISFTTAANGREAVDMVTAQPFDLVLMDIQMPIMDGLTATRTIRQDGRFRSLPILAMTAHAMSADRKRSLEAGLNDHICKPISPDDLTACLLHWMPPETHRSGCAAPS